MSALAPPRTPGLLPPTAKRIFDKALVEARQHPTDSPHRASIINHAHQTVRDKFPQYFK